MEEIEYYALQLARYPETLGRDPRYFTVPRPSIFDVFRTFAAFPDIYVKAADLSQYQNQNEVNYQVMYDNGYRLVILKATEGVSWVDPVFDWHWRNALDTGFYIMVYHFFRDGYSGINQADWFLEKTYAMRQAVQGHTAGWLDNENRSGDPVITITTRRQRCLDWHTNVKTEISKNGEYCSPSLWQSRMGNDDLTKYGDGWLAHWTSAAQPILPTGWEESETKLWQTGVYPTYSWVEPVPGVLGTVDVDRWFGTEQDLRAYLGYEDVPVPPEPHSHPELQEQISVLSSQVASLQSAVADHEARLTFLKQSQNRQRHLN